MAIDAGDLSLILGALGTLIAVVIGAVGTAVVAWRKSAAAMLTAQSAAKKNTVELLEQEICNLHKRLDEQIAENDALRRLNVELMKVNTELQLKLSVQESRTSAQETSIRDLQDRLATKDQEIAELQQELDELRHEKAA